MRSIRVASCPTVGASGRYSVRAFLRRIGIVIVVLCVLGAFVPPRRRCSDDNGNALQIDNHLSIPTHRILSQANGTASSNRIKASANKTKADETVETAPSKKTTTTKMKDGVSLSNVSTEVLQRRNVAITSEQAEETTTDGSLRILYIMTTLAEYNTGKRSTEKGSDRLKMTLIPVMMEGVQSMLDMGYQVDFYLISHYKMLPEREALIRQALPPSVKFTVWDDATPLGYRLDRGDDRKQIKDQTRALARQHRFVIKEQFFNYDFFASFEDDMLIKGSHVKHFLEVTEEINRLRQEAPEYIVGGKLKMDQMFHGNLTKSALQRTLPGFIRVEVLLDEENLPAQKDTGPIRVDLDFDGTNKMVDPSYCCHVSNETSNERIPVSPASSKLLIWETNIIALGIREMPQPSSLGWVMLQRGPNQGRLTNRKAVIGEYYSGKNHEFEGVGSRPPITKGRYINNQGGWMATREQIWEMHTQICPGGFLPPFGPPHYNLDGLDLRNVEYWSGGLSIFTHLNACNMQRIVKMDPDGFSKQLIYHTANNKQHQLRGQREDRFVKANTLLGQLNAVKKKAEKEKLEQLARAKDEQNKTSTNKQ